MAKADEIQIRALVQNWVEAVNDKDIAALCRHHSDDIVLFDVVEPLQSKGIDAYRQSWELQFFPWYGQDGAFDVDELSVVTGNDVAFCHGIIYCSGTDGGQKVNLKIRLTVGLQKIDGEWIILHEHHSEVAK